jgi:hypothetical protein
MELIEGFETSAFRTQTQGNYPKENILHKEHGESLKSRKQTVFLTGNKSEVHDFNNFFLISFTFVCVLFDGEW